MLRTLSGLYWERGREGGTRERVYASMHAYPNCLANPQDGQPWPDRDRPAGVIVAPCYVALEPSTANITTAARVLRAAYM